VQHDPGSRDDEQRDDFQLEGSERVGRAGRRRRRSRLALLRLPSGRAERAAVFAAAALWLAATIAIVVAARLESGGSAQRGATSPVAGVSPRTPDGPPSGPSFPTPRSPAPTQAAATRDPAPSTGSSVWSLRAGLRYDLACDETPCVLHLFDEEGRDQEGWPVAVAGDCPGWVVVGPAESAFIPCNRKGSAVVAALGRDGNPLAGWPASVPGSVAWATWHGFSWGGTEPLAISRDGTVYLGVNPRGNEQRFQIHAFAPNGTAKHGWPTMLPGGAQGFAVAPDGVLVAWWYEDVQESLDLQARRTRFTMLDPAGEPLPGWPIGSVGAASGPVIWANGSIAYTSATGKVWAHDRTGEVIKGWPYRLPYPIAPILRGDGRMLFVGSSEVHVINERGRSLPGWPWHTRSTLDAPGCDTDGLGYEVYALGADDTLYLGLWNGSRSELLALAPNGAKKAGWPYRVPGGWRVTSIEPALDGTVASRLTGGDCFHEFDGTAIRLTREGALIGDAPGTPLIVVYDALRPERLQTIDGLVSYQQNGEIAFRFELVNRSATPIFLPLVDYYGDSYYAAGTIQTWLERLGPDAELDCFLGAGRKEHWYATGGWIVVSGIPVTIQPGGSFPSLFDRSLTSDQTSCLPLGDYRYHVEYKPLEGELEDVIAVRSVPFTIAGAGAAGSPSPTPTTPTSPSPTPPAPSPSPVAAMPGGPASPVTP
jgi:hypothetical protein